MWHSIPLLGLWVGITSAYITGSPTYPPLPHFTNGTAYPGSSTSEAILAAVTSSCSRLVPSQSRYYPLATSQTTPSHGTTPGVTCPNVQYSHFPSSNADESKANAVKEAYVASWNQYSQYCFGQDSLVTTTHSCNNDFGGWGATIVDALDTAIIMNLTEIVAAQLAHIANIDFTSSSAAQPVSAFESTIRYLGGLLSAYDLLTGGFVPNGTYDQAHIDALLQQAVVLAGQLNYRFNTPTGLPADSLYWDDKSYPTDNFVDSINGMTYNSSNAAVCGTFILEYYRLSDLTGDRSYRDIADRATEYLINFGPEYHPVYGNLVGSQLDIDRGNYLTYDFGWKAGIDSFFEYLVKVPVYDPSANPAYLQFWTQLVKDSQKYIEVSPYNAPDLHFLTQADTCGTKEFEMDDYACFAGGNILLGARILPGSSSFADLGLAVTASCFHLYNTTVSGLGPASWAWFDTANHTYDASWTVNTAYIASQQSRGYFILDPQYNSFPESIESIWYAYRITGDQTYRDWNWQIFQALEAESDANQGIVYNGIHNVDQPKTFQDELPSFYFAEVLKYLYLSFTDSSVISLDEWVFNTEAHPFRISGGCTKQLQH